MIDEKQFSRILSISAGLAAPESLRSWSIGLKLESKKANGFFLFKGNWSYFSPCWYGSVDGELLFVSGSLDTRPDIYETNMFI